MALSEPEGIVQEQQRQVWDEAYRAGRIAALREVGCRHYQPPYDCWTQNNTPCRRCRLLAEAASGEDAIQVGDDR